MSKQAAYTLRDGEVICKVVLAGDYLVVIAAAALLAIDAYLDRTYSPALFAVCTAAFLYLAGAQALARAGRQHATAYMLVAFYALLASGIVWAWGVDIPIGTLLFAMTIVLAGILLTARWALFAAMAASLVLAGVQSAIVLHWHTPNMAWMRGISSFGDVLAYSVIFGMLALISWLYNHEMERSLAQAKQAQSALLQQKATLETQVKRRTAELRRVQLEEMQQMYRFAELGQLGVVLLHDLANHLTALILEVEGMQSKQQSKDIARARKIIQYLEDIVDSTRARLHGSTQKQTFDVVKKTSEALTFLQDKAAATGVAIDWQAPARAWKYRGDPTCYCQVVAIITSNAIDAYKKSSSNPSSPSNRKVSVAVQRTKTDIVIKISDWGDGIAKSERKHLFKPYHSAKKAGLGLGLYIAKQTVEMQFGGTIVINPRHDRTEFVIKLPRNES